MKDSGSLHLRVQEMCDCYMNTDPLEEMSKMSHARGNLEESAVKWLALAILHGINSDAEKIAIERSDDGRVKVTAVYRTAELPSPDGDIADAVITAVREITHIEDKGKLPLAIGIRDSSVNLEVKLKSKDGTNKLKIDFK